MVKNPFFENWFNKESSNAMFTKMPNMHFGMREMMESGRKSIQACTEAQQVAAQSMQVIMQRQSEILSQLVQDQSTLAKEIMNEGTPEEKIARGAELIREAYEKTVHGTREVGDIANKSVREAMDIINDRVATAFSEIKSTAEEVQDQKSKKGSNKKSA
jgi:phasin family protein